MAPVDGRAGPAALPPAAREHLHLVGYGQEIDNERDYVKKKMSQATGTEILTELVHQLGFEDILDDVLATTDVTTVMPYASALFSRRAPEDRPKVIPDGGQNFAFLGQPCTRCTRSSGSAGRSRRSTRARMTRRSGSRRSRPTFK